MNKFRAVLRRRWPILIAAAVIGVLAGVLTLAVAPPATTASEVRVSQVVLAGRAQEGVVVGIVAQDALRMTRGEVAARAAEILGQPGRGEELAATLTVEPEPQNLAIQVSTTDTDPDAAAARVDAFVQAFLEVTNVELRQDEETRLSELQRQADEAAARLDAFDLAHPELTQAGGAPTDDASLRALTDQRAQLSGDAQRANQQLTDAQLQVSATAPYSTLGPEPATDVETALLSIPASRWERALIFGAAGLLLGIGLVYLLERIGRRIDTREELAEVTDVPIIAEVARLRRSRRPTHQDGSLRLEGAWAEPYRRLRSAIQFVQTHPQSFTADADAGVDRAATPGVPHSFLVTSAMPGEGKSTSVALTALALSEVGQDTLVVGADVRKPVVERLLGVTSGPTLADRAQLSIDRPGVDQIARPCPSPHLWVAPAGTPTNEVASRLQAAREIAHIAASRGGTVLIDSTPLQVANDAIDLLEVADRVLLVVRSGTTTRQALVDTLDLLSLHGAHLVGVILIATPGAGRMQAYYDYYAAPEPVAGPASVASSETEVPPTPSPQLPGTDSNGRVDADSGGGRTGDLESASVLDDDASVSDDDGGGSPPGGNATASDGEVSPLEDEELLESESELVGGDEAQVSGDVEIDLTDDASNGGEPAENDGLGGEVATTWDD